MHLNMAINFAFGFFGGFFVVSFAQIKELFLIAIVGTSTATLNIFPFAGGAILQQVSGLMLTTRSLVHLGLNKPNFRQQVLCLGMSI